MKPKKMIIEKLQPKTRSNLIKFRIMAYKGDFEKALSDIDNELSNKSLKKEDFVALALLKAELFWLNGQFNESMDVFKSKIDQNINKLPEDLLFIIRDNNYFVAFSLLDKNSSRDFYYLVDERRSTGQDIGNASKILSALRASEIGKNYESLPAFEIEVKNSYNSGSWRDCHQSYYYLSKELLKLGNLDKATFYAIQSLNEQLVESVSEQLIFSRNINLIETTIRLLIKNFNLILHAKLSCLLLSNISDCIPDNQINETFNYLIKYCSNAPQLNNYSNVFESSWKALETLAPRLNSKQLNRIISCAIGHILWKSKNFYRKEIIKVLNTCVTFIEEEKLGELTAKVLPLTSELKNDFDYIEVLNLFCHIAQKGNEKLKEKIGNNFYPKKTSQYNTVFLQVAPIFNKEIFDKNQFNKNVQNIAQKIGLIVQHLNKDEKPVNLGGYGTIGKTNNDTQIVISMNDFSMELIGISNYVNIINPEILNELIKSIIKSINDPDNIITNKVSLIWNLNYFSEGFDTELIKLVFKELNSFASGKKISTKQLTDYNEALSKLNRFRINEGNPYDLQAAAIYTLSKIESKHPKAFGKKLNKLIEDALNHNNKIIRRSAYAALREIPKLTRSQTTQLILGTYETDTEIASLVFEAIAVKNDLNLSNNDLEILINSLSKAVYSSFISIRKQAAFATIKLLIKAKNKKIKNKLESIISLFEKDMSFSVRQNSRI